MINEDDLIPISALQHVLFCERQYALIHIEQLWAENRFTAEGDVLHERVHDEHHESRKNFRQEYGMPVRSLEYGLIGKCDLVELWLGDSGKPVSVNPVEFKRGKTKPNDVDRVQLCAQALCLEEMCGVIIGKAQFYYLQEKRRSETEIDATLREKTMSLVKRIHEINASSRTPPPVYEKKKCVNCSLFDLCMPKNKKNVAHYVAAQLRETASPEEASDA
jgi:CRISPR-associated exonuclease Cas4